MKKISNIILIILLISSCSNFNTISINNQTFKVEIAETAEEHSQGLMFRKDLPKDNGMLFIFKEEKNVSFWMKNTLIPLDIIWIDKDFNIIGVSTAEPCKEDPCKNYNSPNKVKYVLEINANSGIKSGKLKI